MSDFLKKAASLIFDVEDTQANTSQLKLPGTPPGAIQSNLSQNNFIAVTPSPEQSSGIDDKIVSKFQQYFKDLYNNSNLQGPDFYEFTNMSDAMGSALTDEVKYPAVFAGFSGQLTKEKLLSSAETYIDIIKADSLEFEHSIQLAIKTKVTDRKAQIETKAQEIQKLQDKIGKLNNEIIELNQLSNQEEVRLSSEQKAYYQQSEAIQHKIETGVEKIKLYIK